MTSDLLLSYYGDDFTGSTDVLEALTTGGVETVLFTTRPDEEQLSRFNTCRAVGLAGISRSQTPDWMDAHLPALFGWLKSLSAPFCHYKVCSTFDSAPDKGSVGRALEIGLATFGQRHTTVLVGAPQLRRYTYFATLFAAYRGEIHRIDRHPVMSRHPATPMAEADLIKHLKRQTALPFVCVGPEDLARFETTGRCPPMDAPRSNWFLDVFDSGSQKTAGRLLTAPGSGRGPFLAGSSGVEYALLTAWQEAGLIAPSPALPALTAEDRIAVVSGSCSPTTARQIDHALGVGFDGIAVDYKALAGGIGLDEEITRVSERASSALADGVSPLLFTARGESETLPDAGPSNSDRAGEVLGTILDHLTQRHDLKRVCVAGGDTSSHAMKALGIFALTLRQPLPSTPGSPVCTGHYSRAGSVEIALKGGQIGTDSYFADLRDATFAIP